MIGRLIDIYKQLVLQRGEMVATLGGLELREYSLTYPYRHKIRPEHITKQLAELQFKIQELEKDIDNITEEMLFAKKMVEDVIRDDNISDRW